MDSFFPTIWNVLHDGVIVAIDGAVPGTIRLQCDDGVLEVVATDGSVQPDSGHAVTLQELINVADDYWREWSERAKRLNRKSE